MISPASEPAGRCPTGSIWMRARSVPCATTTHCPPMPITYPSLEDMVIPAHLVTTALFLHHALAVGHPAPCTLHPALAVGQLQ